MTFHHYTIMDAISFINSLNAAYGADNNHCCHAIAKLLLAKKAHVLYVYFLTLDTGYVVHLQHLFTEYDLCSKKNQHINCRLT